MATWLLTCNPNVFDLPRFRDDGHRLTSWTISQYKRDAARGDRFVLWVTGSNAGIVAHGHLTGSARRGMPDTDYWVDDPGERDFVPLEVDQWLERRIPKSQIAADPRMARATILTMPGGRNPHRLSAEEWSAISETFDITPAEDPSWELLPGDEIRRVALHKQYGGSSQNGISPSRTTDNILIFTDPSSGHQHGYFDTWNEDGTFHYTGEGQTGDQKMVRGNRAILEHLNSGKRLRLFEGARGTVRYLGEWALNPDQAYSEAEAPATGGGPMRKVIRFHLVPVKTTITTPEVGVGQNYVAPDQSVSFSPALPSAPDPDLMGRNLSTHRRLQNELAEAALDRGFTALSPSVADPDFDVAWRDPDGRVSVCEVKSLTIANEGRQLRTGLGQVLDYQDQLRDRVSDLAAVLWVEREPSESRWVDLCRRVGVLLAWPGQEDVVFDAPHMGLSAPEAHQKER